MAIWYRSIRSCNTRFRFRVSFIPQARRLLNSWAHYSCHFYPILLLLTGYYLFTSPFIYSLFYHSAHLPQQYYISIYISIFYSIVLYTIFYSYILNFCISLFLFDISCLKFSFYLCDFLSTYFWSIVGESLRIKNFIANDCFYVIVVHMTVKILNLKSIQTSKIRQNGKHLNCSSSNTKYS